MHWYFRLSLLVFSTFKVDVVQIVEVGVDMEFSQKAT